MCSIPTIIDPEKEYTCQKGLLVVNWDQIHNQNLAAIVYGCLLCTFHFREKPQTELPSLLHVFLSFDSTPVKESLVLYQ